jgi:hypothetical protein
VFGSSAAGGDVTVSGTLAGGAGGSAIDLAASGAGQSVALANAVDGATAGALSLRQTAQGGNGGAAQDGAHGSAGSASSTLSKTDSAVSLTLYGSATGGYGGDRTGATGVAGTGADSSVDVDATNLIGSARAFSDSRGGSGGWSSTGGSGGNGGDATGTARATSTLDFQSATASGSVVGGDGGSIYSVSALGGDGGDGGDATSRTTAIALGDGVVEANDSARAGSGGSDYYYYLSSSLGEGGNGGDATSEAHASNLGASSVYANASAFGGGGGSFPSGTDGAGGNASALATGSSVTGFVNLGAYAYGTAAAIARTEASTADLAYSTAQANAVGGALSYLSASNNESASGTQEIEARAAIGAVAPTAFAGLEGVAFATGMPLSQDIQASLVGNPNAAASMAEAASSYLALGTLGGGSAAPDATAGGSSYASITLGADLALVPMSGVLRVGLLDVTSTGNGFDSLQLTIYQEGVLVFDQAFGTLGTALAFFEDNVLELGDPTLNLVGDLDLTITLFSQSAAPGDSFFATLAVAVVPEPQLALLLLAAASFFAVKRRAAHGR